MFVLAGVAACLYYIVLYCIFVLAVVADAENNAMDFRRRGSPASKHSQTGHKVRRGSEEKLLYSFVWKQFYNGGSCANLLLINTLSILMV